jgi:uncharacterized protein YbaR (Trm112 family)
MKCPYCEGELETGVLLSQKVPEWNGENSKFKLQVKKKMTTNEMNALYCKYCNKIIISNA